MKWMKNSEYVPKTVQLFDLHTGEPILITPERGRLKIGKRNSPNLSLTKGSQCLGLGHSNWTICSQLSQFCSPNFATFRRGPRGHTKGTSASVINVWTRTQITIPKTMLVFDFGLEDLIDVSTVRIGYCDYHSMTSIGYGDYFPNLDLIS